MPITHKKHSDIPDGTDETLIRPSDWNDTHEITNGIAILDSSGVFTIENIEVTIPEKIFLSRHTGNSNMSIYVSSVSPGISFTITSAGGADDSGLSIGWMII